MRAGEGMVVSTEHNPWAGGLLIAWRYSTDIPGHGRRALFAFAYILVWPCLSLVEVDLMPWLDYGGLGFSAAYLVMRTCTWLRLHDWRVRVERG